MRVECFERGSLEMNHVKRWWAERERVPFSDSLASDYGYMAYSENNPVAAMFLYPTKGSSVCMIGWPITDPNTTKEERNLALNELFDKIHKEARLMGYKLVWSFSGVEPVQNRMIELGYVIGDQNINQYFKGL